MQALALEIVALLVYGPLIVLLHESGHALFARLGGYRVTSFGIGLGRPFWRVQLSRGVVFHLDRWLLAGGACVAFPSGPPTLKRAWFHAGGLILQAVLAVVLLALPHTWLGDRIAQFNLIVAATNALPWRWGGSASDGWYLLDLFRGQQRAAEVLPQRPALQRMAARERQTDSRLGTAYAELCLAWVDVLACRPADAGRFFAKDPPETALDPWVDALYHFVHAQWHRLEGRPLAALRIAREAPGVLAEGAGDDAIGLLALAEAQALVDLDEPAAAMRTLGRIAGVSGLVGRQATVALLAASLDAPDDLELATWRVVRRAQDAWLDPTDAASTLWEAARRLDAAHRIDAARGAREAARTLARRTLASATPEDHAALLPLLGPAAGFREAKGWRGEASP